MTDHAKILGDALAAHSIKATLKHQYTGPSVGLYAYQLTAGQSVKALLAVAQDLAVAVGQEAVRILAPIPGTSLVGIEVPHNHRATVDYTPVGAYEGCWSCDQTGGLMVPIGVDVKSEVIEADLTALPHLLIAGSTGSGKSVALNTIITALIDRNSPAEVRLHLIDPKRVELAQFRDAPQVESLVTNLDEAEVLLEDLVDLMEVRYSTFEDHGVRNIGEYNLLVEEEGDSPILPYHVIVIDEMADLMMQRKKEVEPLIVRIAQLARAAGIHLILATQRPTVDVITGLIKANVPSRLAFTVASVKDSMVILDQSGANALAGKGDALFLPIGQQRPVRVQGVWTSDEMIKSIVDDACAAFDPPVQSVHGSRAAEDEEEISIFADNMVAIRRNADFGFDLDPSSAFLNTTIRVEDPDAGPWLTYVDHSAPLVETENLGDDFRASVNAKIGYHGPVVAEVPPNYLRRRVLAASALVAVVLALVAFL